MSERETQTVTDPRWSEQAERAAERSEAEAHSRSVAKASWRDLDDDDVLAPEREETGDAADEGCPQEECTIDAATAQALLSQPFPIGDVLRDGTAAELERRDGEWSAFSASVFRQIDAQSIEETRMTIEDRAIAMMRANVEGELAEIEPRLETQFARGVEQRIWRAAKATPTLKERIAGWFEWLPNASLLRPAGFAAAAAMAIVALAMFGIEQPPPALAPPQGHVTVDRMSFAGTATLLDEDGLSVVWLSDDES